MNVQRALSIDVMPAHAAVLDFARVDQHMCGQLAHRPLMIENGPQRLLLATANLVVVDV